MGAGPPVRVTLPPKRLANPTGASSYCGHADAADGAAGAYDAERLLVGGHVPDGLEHDVGAVAAGELADSVDALLAALGDHVGGAELAAEVGAGLVAAHQDDLLGAQALGREHGEQPDGAVADDGDRGAGPHAAVDRGVVAGAEDVGEGEQGGDQRRVGGRRGA